MGRVGVGRKAVGRMGMGNGIVLYTVDRTLHMIQWTDIKPIQSTSSSGLISNRIILFAVNRTLCNIVFLLFVVPITDVLCVRIFFVI